MNPDLIMLLLGGVALFVGGYFFRGWVDLHFPEFLGRRGRYR